MDKFETEFCTYLGSSSKTPTMYLVIKLDVFQRKIVNFFGRKKESSFVIAVRRL